jgi:uroporphyrin-III C-methyltransferase
MSPPLLTAHDATGHVHLVVGANPLAAARCAKSLEVGAQPIVVVPETTPIHYSLQKRIDEGQVRHIARQFWDEALQTLGRLEVGGVVDAVFVTHGGKSALSRDATSCITDAIKSSFFQVLISLRSAAG